MLEWAYVRCRANGGASGVDGQTFEDIEAYGLGRWLDELAEDLRKRTYLPQPVRRVYIAKGDGTRKALGHPLHQGSRSADGNGAGLGADLRGRSGAGAVRLSSRAPRLDAVRQVERLVRGGRTAVVDGDLSGYFDAIPHAELMKSLSRRISDRFVLKLIKLWLETPVEELDARGHRHRTTGNKDEGKGSPQGSPISPLLSNIYMRRLCEGVEDRRLRAAAQGSDRQLRG